MGSTLLIDGMNLFTSGLWAAGPWSLVIAQAAESDPSQLAQLAKTAWLVLQVALGLGFVIFVHELGHFLAAKTFGVRCDKFYVGFDVPISIGPIKLPSSLGKFQWGETEYGIGIIPLGGYVKMLGQDDDPRKAEEEAERIRLGGGDDAPLDPRSYPAKPVWQRMIIISAGVVMNLIFAVILAGVAYRNGVPYTPTVAGVTMGGGPAWQAGVQPGDQILRIGDMKEDYSQLRFSDFQTQVVMNGFERKSSWIDSILGKQQDAPAELPCVILRDGERVEKTLFPSSKQSPDADFLLIGILSSGVTTVAKPPYSADQFIAQSKPDLQPGDEVIAVNDEPLAREPGDNQIPLWAFEAKSQAYWNEPIRLTVERKNEGSDSKQTLEVQVPAVPVKTLGFGFAAGPITAIIPGSLGEQAGLKVGDVIQKVNGEAIANALELPSTLAKLSGSTAQIEVQRAEESISIKLQLPPQASFDRISQYGGELTLGGTGVAFSVSDKVSSIDTSIVGTDSQVQIGDQLGKLHWNPSEEKKKELIKDSFSPEIFKPFVIDDSSNVASLHLILQQIPEASSISCTFSRDGQIVETGTYKVAHSKGWFWPERGIQFMPLERTHRTTSLAAAASLGFWETSRRFTEVLGFLKLLVTGRVGSKGLGGPVRIAYVAGKEADMGISRLMLFLTFLSANLAILNFLPIPALDGGHMIFLAAEAVRGKPVSEALQIRLTMMGVLGLLSLMAFVIVKDLIWVAS